MKTKQKRFDERVTIRFHPKHLVALEKEADRRGQTVGGLIREIVVTEMNIQGLVQEDAAPEGKKCGPSTEAVRPVRGLAAVLGGTEHTKERKRT